jgi:hypothetical protein
MVKSQNQIITNLPTPDFGLRTKSIMLNNWLKMPSSIIKRTGFLQYQFVWINDRFDRIYAHLMHWNDEESYEKWNPKRKISTLSNS